MAHDPAGSVTQFFAQLRAGDAAAAGPLWERYFPRLRGLARKTLAGFPQRMSDADDAVQSAFASFWQRAREGAFGDQLNRDELWRLLGVITMRKSRRHLRHERTAKRGGGRVVDEAALRGHEETGGIDETHGEIPSADFDLHCAELLETLDDEQQRIALLRLLGYKNREIADQLDCTERKVERKLNLIRLKWESAWPG